MRGVSHRTGDQDRTYPFFIQREDPVVLEQDRRFFSRLAGSFKVLRGILYGLASLCVDVGMLEKAEHELDS